MTAAEERVLVTGAVVLASPRGTEEVRDVAVWLTPLDGELQHAPPDSGQKTRYQILQKDKRFDPRYPGRTARPLHAVDLARALEPI